MDVIFAGPPGAGKGTQAKLAAAKLGVRHLSTGDLLRSAVAAKTELGLEAQSFMDKGLLVPDELVERMLEAELRSAPQGQGFLFDGYPRNAAQADTLATILTRTGRTIAAVVLIDVPDAVIEARIAGRRSCKCGAMYHVNANPPAVEGRCDACGSDLTIRADDRPEVVSDRLSVYHTQTEAPLIGKYEAAGLVHKIDGTQSIDDVHAAVMAAIEKA